MKKVLFAIALLGVPAWIVTADFNSDLQAAAALCKDGKHAEAIQAWINLGDSSADVQEQYAAICKAAECARLHEGGEARALEMAAYLKTEPYGKACRAFVYQWSGAFSNIVAEFENEDLAAWPEDMAANGYKVRGGAHFNLKHGPQAARDFLKTFQCSKSYDKWTAMRMLGQTYWKLLDDPLIAEGCFRKCISDFGGGHPGLQARVELADLLLEQKRYEDALKCLQAPADRPGAGYWLGALLYSEAKVNAAMGRKAEAINALETVLKTHGINQYQQKDCEKMLATLRPGAAPQTSQPAK
ncbi:MAG: hypothetical protein WC299_09830 [Kiritimatiellia bacterium]